MKVRSKSPVFCDDKIFKARFGTRIRKNKKAKYESRRCTKPRKINFTVEEGTTISFLKSVELKKENEILWSEQEFQQQFIDRLPVFKRASRKKARVAAKMFLNLYVSNKFETEEYEKIVLLLWSYMKVEDTYVFSDKFHNDPSAKVITGKSKSPQQLTKLGYRFANPKKKNIFAIQVNETRKISIKYVMNWYKQLWNSLSLEDEEDLEQVDLAINFLGFLALALVPLTVTDIYTMQDSIVTNVTKQFAEFWRTEMELDICVPPNVFRAIDLSKNSLQRCSVSSVTFLTYLVDSFTALPEGNKPTIVGQILSTALQPVIYHGFGAFKWVEKASAHLEIEPNKLLKNFKSVDNRAHLKAIYRFLNRYVNNPAEKTWPWATMFVDRTFSHLSMENVPFIAIACAAIVHTTDMESPFWDQPEFKNIRRRSESLFGLALKSAVKIKKRYQAA